MTDDLDPAGDLPGLDEELPEGADAPPGPDPADPEDGGGLLDILRRSEPAIDVRAVEEQINIAVPWHNHLAAGILKASGSDSLEVWMHFLIAGLLLVHQSGEPATEQQEQGNTEVEDLGGDGREVETGGEHDGQTSFDGPVT